MENYSENRLALARPAQLKWRKAGSEEGVPARERDRKAEFFPH